MSSDIDNTTGIGEIEEIIESTDATEGNDNTNETTEHETNKEKEAEIGAVSVISRRMSKLNSVCEGWAMLPHLFDIWDDDKSGSLDEDELFAGLSHYCTARNIDVDRQAVLNILSDVDDNGDRLLDNREFAVFFSRFADLVGCCISDLALFMMKQLNEEREGTDSMQDENSVNTKESNLFADLSKPTARNKGRTSWMGLFKAVQKASTNDDSGNTSNSTSDSTIATTPSERLDLQQLEQQLDEKIQMIYELEFKLRQREDAIEHLEQALEAKDETITLLRDELDAQQVVDAEDNISGDIAGGPLCHAPSLLHKKDIKDEKANRDESKATEAEGGTLSLEERQLKSEEIFASIRTSFATTSA